MLFSSIVFFRYKYKSPLNEAARVTIPVSSPLGERKLLAASLKRLFNFILLRTCLSVNNCFSICKTDKKKLLVGKTNSFKILIKSFGCNLISFHYTMFHTKLKFFDCFFVFARIYCFFSSFFKAFTNIYNTVNMLFYDLKFINCPICFSDF